MNDGFYSLQDAIVMVHLASKVISEEVIESLELTLNWKIYLNGELMYSSVTEKIKSNVFSIFGYGEVMWRCC